LDGFGVSDCSEKNRLQIEAEQQEFIAGCSRRVGVGWIQGVFFVTG